MNLSSIMHPFSHITLSNGMIINTRRSNKAKKLILKIKKGDPELVLPTKTTIKFAREFLEQAQTITWLDKHLPKYQKFTLTENGVIKILGAEYQVVYSSLKNRGVEMVGRKLVVYGDITTATRKVKRFLTAILKHEIYQLVNIACKKLNLKYNNITIKEMTTRLGSCSSRGNLNFCLRLIFTEYFILEYVVAHEVCHLKEMNHSKNFWQLVKSIYPNLPQAKRWLKENKMIVL